MFKKSLLALALAGASVAATAGTIEISASTNVSQQGNSQLGDNALASADLGSIAINPNSNYIVNDVIVITVSGAKFDTKTTPTLTPAAGTAAFDFVDFPDSNTVRYRVSTANHDKANNITIANVKLDTTGSVVGGKITLASKAVSINSTIGDYDASKGDKDLAVFVDEFKVAVTTSLDEKIATGEGRQEFVGGKTDSLIYTLTDEGSAVDEVTFAKVTHVLKGSDLGFAFDYDLKANGGDADGKLSSAELAKAFVVSATNVAAADTFALALNAAKTELTITQTVNGGVDTPVTVTPTVIGKKDGGSIIAAQSFTVDVTAANTAATASASKTGVSAGSWSLDGQSEDIALMPFSSDYAQSITVVNTGTVEGAITVTITANGMTKSKTLTAVASAKAVTNISKEVAAFAAEIGVADFAHVNVVVNAPKTNIVVKGVYYHKKDGDRVLTK